MKNQSSSNTGDLINRLIDDSDDSEELTILRTEANNYSSTKYDKNHNRSYNQSTKFSFFN